MKEMVQEEAILKRGIKTGPSKKNRNWKIDNLYDNKCEGKIEKQMREQRQKEYEGEIYFVCEKLECESGTYPKYNSKWDNENCKITTEALKYLESEFERKIFNLVINQL